MSFVHSEQTASDGNHVTIRWVHADSTERLAGSYVEADEGGVSQQTDDKSLWILKDYTGPTFVEFGSGGGGGGTAATTTFTPAGTIASTDVQAAIEELDSDVSTLSTTVGGNTTAISDHIADTTDAHDASAISFVSNGDIAATDVQAAIQEVRDDTDTKLAAKVTGPASSTDNALARFDSTTGKLIQNSGAILDDSNNLSGLVNVDMTGRVRLADLSAPSNPGAGFGVLYKKTGQNGVHWKSGASGPEIDLTEDWLAPVDFTVNTSSANWVNPDGTLRHDEVWTNTSGAASGTPVFTATDGCWTIAYDCTVIEVIVYFSPDVSSATAAFRFGLYRSRPTYGSATTPSVGVVIAGTDTTHTTVPAPYIVSTNSELSLGAGVDLDKYDQLIPVVNTNGTINSVSGSVLVKVRKR